MRQHVNPLSRFFQEPRALPSLDDLFENGERPLHLDIGCARGMFLMEMAQLHPDWNHLGLEIRAPLVRSAEAERERRELVNLRYLFANATVTLPGWLNALPPGRLRRITILFPDPWFKTRHQKRRVLQPPLLAALARATGEGAELYFQSDVPEAIASMVALSEAGGTFARPSQDARPWRTESPYPVRTERERLVAEQGGALYRVLLLRTAEPAPDEAVADAPGP
ncbi:tRNA (guanosine(46)-N7)-methyltransferase TrmB [Synechococcus sp. RSCCF101]|uniref:tRNA (guanosine(46)-N7)-methyltransferase TrmB n=1 Tax=Synechococcus sp. RSCCF101 TaxID=2511069 RepID=UPI0012448572|nr:tRNA (guanosine(46)-N7)-methyltransferase TrmB [Synechococcus sp. RSCCF101]QEY32253.1 tRNA (guanosine(46)-N7)-methyltransferase TrmB [Synechococcus sp. RSCCF101]